MGDADRPSRLREELGSWLHQLARGRAHRRDAARWAIEAVVAHDPARDPPEHPFVWELVERVGCADLETAAGVWLHDGEDFRAWGEDLARREAAGPSPAR